MAVEHYTAAVTDLQRLLALSGSSKDVAARLRSAQVAQRSQGSAGPNHYLLLGVQQHATSAEIKAAYK
jgi:DnaJ-class molecular chaperone